MRRREFLGVMGAAASAWPIAAASQAAPPRIGVLFAGAEGSPESKATFAEISEGLRDVGLIEGRDYVIPHDIKRLAVPIFGHRVVVSARAAMVQKKSDLGDRIVEEILQHVDVPL